MYKILVDFDGFINIGKYSFESAEKPNIVISRIEDPFSSYKYLGIFRPKEYLLFHVTKASGELFNSGVYFILYWVGLDNGILTQWHIDINGNYISQSRVLSKDTILELLPHLSFFIFPGYINILNLLSDNLFKNNNDYRKILKFLNNCSNKSKCITQDFSMLSFFRENVQLSSRTIYFSISEYSNLINKFGNNQKLFECVGNLEIYKEIDTKGDLVFFETDHSQYMTDDQVFEWKVIEKLFALDSTRGQVYQNRNWLNLIDNIKYSVLRLFTGYAWCKCPFTGKVLKSNKSILVPVSSNSIYIAYYFESTYPFFLLSYGGWGSNNCAIYLPIVNICLVLRKTHQWGFEKVIDKLIQIFQSDQELINLYFQRNDPKNKCLFIDQKDNLGHYIWQDLSGLSLIFDETNLSSHIKSYLSNSKSRYQDHCFIPENIFPQLNKKYAYKENTEKENITQIALRENLFLFKIEDIVVSDFVIPRIHDYSKQHSFTILQYLLKEKNEGAKVLLVNLRTHNKVWTNAAQVLTKVFNTFASSSYSAQKIIVLYDGFKDIRPTINLIKQNVFNPNIIHIDCTELIIPQTCALVELIDSFICTVGSGLVIPTWLYNKPGIAHGDKVHLAQKTLWYYVTPQMYNPDLVEFLDESEIEFSGDENYSNYQISVDVVMGKIRKLLN